MLMNKAREKNIYDFSQVKTIKIPMVLLASQTGLNLNIKFHRISLYLTKLVLKKFHVMKKGCLYEI